VVWVWGFVGVGGGLDGVVGGVVCGPGLCWGGGGGLVCDWVGERSHSWFSPYQLIQTGATAPRTSPV